MKRKATDLSRLNIKKGTFKKGRGGVLYYRYNTPNYYLKDLNADADWDWMFHDFSVIRDIPYLWLRRKLLDRPWEIRSVVDRNGYQNAWAELVNMQIENGELDPNDPDLVDDEVTGEFNPDLNTLPGPYFGPVEYDL